MDTVKTIVVTGANRGIGLEICRQLAAMGHHVILCARDLAKGQAAAAGLPGAVEVRALDVADAQSIRAFAEALQSAHPHVDVLINNAGVISSAEGLAKTSFEEMQQVFAPNFFGPMLLSQALLPLLRKRPGARIIHLSSQMGGTDALTAGYAAYRLSKYALNGLTMLMASEFGSYGITVNAMCPGWVKTDMGGSGAMLSVAQGADSAVWLATADKIPSGKFVSGRKVRAW